MTPIANNEDHQCGNNYKKKIEGDENGLKTVDCLRGRLLAERQASRLANQDAQILGQKLLEVENKLKQEIKLRQKADKKLKLLMKKLQSLNISPTSDSSEITDFSSASISSTSSADHSQSPSKSDIQHQDKDSSSNADSQSSSISEEESYKVDNSLALVAVPKSSVDRNVSEVLEALKLAREMIEMERRKKMI